MNNLPALALALSEGFLLGAFFFGALWWTIRRAVGSSRAGLWFGGSLLVRTAVTLAGFYTAAGGDWQRMLAAALGFFPARALVVRLTARKGAP